MKQNISSLRLLSFALLLIFLACKKDNPSDNQKDEPEVSVHADDELLVTSEIDGVFNDATKLLESDGSISPRIQENLICDATVSVDLISNPQTITVTYNGAKCLGNLSREGVVTLSAAKGMQWENAGATFKVIFTDFKITRDSDKKSITLNGEQSYTNLNGGTLAKLSTLESVIHTVVSNGLSVTFKDGSKRTWQVSQKRVYTYNNGIVATVLGMRTEGNDTNIAIWGINRFGTAFTSSITSPIVIRQDCSFRLTEGEIKHTLGPITATATFGLNASGNPVSCPSGKYYYKLAWADSEGNDLQVLLPY